MSFACSGCLSKRAFAVIIGLFVALGPSGWSQPGAGDKGDYYPLVPGTRWDFRFRIVVGKDVKDKGSISEVVAGVETINNIPLVRVEAHVEGKVVATEHLRVTDTGVYRYRTQGAEAKPPLLVLRYPVKTGDSWQYATQVGNESIQGSVQTRFDVVEVPVGKIKCVATDIDFQVDGKPLKATIWFAEGIGKVKQTLELGDGNQVILELDKFTLGKP